ncbi:MAG TPA: hypothetical protein VNU72_13320, partial [Puia sp.]|nr:hypothetical protein [Puia sp.]
TGPAASSSDEKVLEELGNNEQKYRGEWESLRPVERFILFDLAKDGFTNYRTAWILYKLRKAGHLQFKGGILQFTDFGFREFVLHQAGNKDVQAFLNLAQQAGTWQSFRMPLMILFATFGLFIFFTQDALYQKISGLIATFISIRPMLSSLFPKGNNDRPDLDTALNVDTTPADAKPSDAVTLPPATPPKDPPV